MTRTLGAGFLTSIEADNAMVVQFVELHHSGGVIRMTTAPMDVDWDGETWTATGHLLSMSPVTESNDRKNQGMRVELSGVQTDIISAILNNNVRGRLFKMWTGHIDQDTGDVLSEPLLEFQGYQNDRYSVEEERNEDGIGTTVVSTRVVSSMARIRAILPLKTNTASHNDFMRRAGFVVNDDMMRLVPVNAGRRLYWGRPAPEGPNVRFVGGGGGGRGEEGGVDRHDRTNQA